MLSKEEEVSPSLFKLGDEFELDLGAMELRKGSRPQRLGRIPMELLLLLVERRGQLVTRERIIERIWGKDVFLDTDNSINAAIRKIRQVFADDAEEPRYVQTLIGRGYRFIAAIQEVIRPDVSPLSALKVTATEPGAGLEDKAESEPSSATAAGEGGDSSQRANQRQFLPGIWRESGVLAALGAVVLLGFAGTVDGVRNRLFHRSAVDPRRSITIRPSIAVLGFKNLSGQTRQEWLSTALSEMLSAELASGQKVRLIAGENVARMKVELALPEADSYAADTLARIQKNLGSDMVVLGSYLAMGSEGSGKVRVNLQVQDVRTGETIASVSEDGTEAELAELMTRSGERVRESLGNGGVNSSDAEQVRAALPENPEAARLYVEGLVKLRGFDILAARDLLLKASTLDPRHALSHAALSECFWSLGMDRKAGDEGEKALTLSGTLPREAQLSVEARYRWSAHQWPRAIEVYKALWEAYPDNIDYGANLARVQAAAGLGKDAMATVDALNKSPLAVGDPRIDFAEASAADKLGDLRREERAAARAAEKGEQLGTRILTGRALLTRGAALSALGDNENAVANLKRAQGIFEGVGDNLGVARVLNNLSIIERHQANLNDAQKDIERALAMFRKAGSQQGVLIATNNLANIHWERGDLAKAVEMDRQSLKVSREMDDKLHECSALGNLAGLLQLQGKLSEAHKTYEQALRLAIEMGDREGMGLNQGNLADLLYRQGDLPGARKMAEDATQTDQQSGVKSLEGYALYQLAEVLAAQGDTNAAKSKFDESEKLRHELHEAVTEAESRLAVAQIELDTHEPKAAEQTLRGLVDVFHSGASIDNEALSYSLLAMAFAERGNTREMEQALAKSSELLRKTRDRAIRLEVQISIAFAPVICSRSPQSKSDLHARLIQSAKQLEAAKEKAQQLGYVGIELKAREHLAELELQRGDAPMARAHLKDIQREAQARGFALIAKQAAAL